MAAEQKEKSEKIFGWPTNWWIAISSISAVVISLCALFLTIYQGCETRKHARLSFRPDLNISFYYEDKGAGWAFISSGLGPSRLQSFKVTVDNQPVYNWTDVALKLGLSTPLTVDFTYLHPGNVINPGISNNFILDQTRTR